VADQMSEQEADRHLEIGIKNLQNQGLIELKQQID
jgi:hypothetical protein